jgi:hypothetical protein
VPALRRSAEHRGAAGPGGAAAPTLERVITFTFTAADRGTQPSQAGAFQDHMESLYGPFADLSWLEGGAVVSYHDMARVVARELAAELARVDLVITVDASPDCRHQSFPGCLLTDLMPGEPLMMGISEQGVAGPFTAISVAARQLSSGGSRRALILIMEQSTLPPDDDAVRPQHDVAVALLLGPDGTISLGGAACMVTGRAGRAGTAPVSQPAAHLPRAESGATLIVGAGLSDLSADPGVTVIHAPHGHPCAGVWLALAEFLHQQRPSGGRILVTDCDPILPYLCSVALTVPTEPSAVAGGRIPARHVAAPAAIAPAAAVKELVR